MIFRMLMTIIFHPIKSYRMLKVSFEYAEARRNGLTEEFVDYLRRRGALDLD